MSGGQVGYEKYVHNDKGYEVVYDTKNKKIVTDPVNKGTYNHFNPGGLTDNVGHVLLDVIPYFARGNDEKIIPNSNTPTDPTWATDRIGRTFYKPNEN